MSDSERRETERLAVGGDPAAKRRLAYLRCRADECCFHAEGAPSIPPLPPDAEGVRVWADPVGPIELERFIVEGRHRARVEINLTGRSAHHLTVAIEWVLSLFPTIYDPLTGVMDVPPSLHEVLYPNPPSGDDV